MLSRKRIAGGREERRELSDGVRAAAAFSFENDIRHVQDMNREIRMRHRISKLIADRLSEVGSDHSGEKRLGVTRRQLLSGAPPDLHNTAQKDNRTEGRETEGNREVEQWSIRQTRKTW